MARGRRGSLDALLKLPWPVSLLFGVLGFFAIRHGLPALLSSQTEPLEQAFAKPSPFTPLAWLFLAGCSLASFISFLGAQRKRRLLATRTDLESIAALGWRDFERLVGEAFRQQGHAVEETGLGGADGGIDLILRRDGKRILVQCKQWRRDKVPVNVVREMYGLLTHHRADEMRIATLGDYTDEARTFAQGKPIKLIDGPALLGMIRAAQNGNAAQRSRNDVKPLVDRSQSLNPSAPTCPRCGATMLQRTNRRSGQTFWGCSTYPRCTATR